MKKIFLVEVENYDYDMYDSVVVVAESEEQAIALCEDMFEEDQGKITAKEINPNASEPKVILASYNAG